MFQSLGTQEAERPLDAKGELREDGTFELSTRDLGPDAASGEYRALVRAIPDLKRTPNFHPPPFIPASIASKPPACSSPLPKARTISPSSWSPVRPDCTAALPQMNLDDTSTPRRHAA